MNTFYLPVNVITGDGSFSSLAETAVSLGTRALIVSSPSAKASGALGQAKAMLSAAGLTSDVFLKESGEPTLSMVEAGREVARRNKPDLVIGIGGGSSIDLAKAIAGLTLLNGTVQEYFDGKPIDGAPLPWIAVPTTSGTGAEVTKNAVLLDQKSLAKKSIRSDSWFARVAIVDPVLAATAPPVVTAHSGADALCQAIESFVSLGAMPITDALCREAIRLIGRSLVRAYRDGQDLAARRDMHYGSLMAGMALANARLGAVHGLAHPIGARYHLAHGLVCGLLLPHVMEWNLHTCADRYAEVAQLLGACTTGMTNEEAAVAAVNAVRDRMRQIGIPERLSDIGVHDMDFDGVARQSMSSSMKHNPRPM